MREYPYEKFSIGNKKGFLYHINNPDEQIEAHVFMLDNTFITVGGNDLCVSIAPQVIKTMK